MCTTRSSGCLGHRDKPSVKHGIIIETKYKTDIPELSLSDAIGAESPYKPSGPVGLLAKLLVRHDRYKKSGLLHSDGKIELFYKSIMLALLITTVILALLGGVEIERTESDIVPSSISPVVIPDTDSTSLDEPSADQALVPPIQPSPAEPPVLNTEEKASSPAAQEDSAAQDQGTDE